MAPITLERDPLGTYILSCRCGNIEMGRGARWMAFRITPQPNGSGSAPNGDQLDQNTWISIGSAAHPNWPAGFSLDGSRSRQGWSC